MKKTKQIKKLTNKINNKRPKAEDIKLFPSIMIELMAESGIPPRTRKEFYRKVNSHSPDVGKIIEFAEDTLGLISEKAC